MIKFSTKVLMGIPIVLGIILTLLQIYQIVDFVSPMYFFMVYPIPIYGIILLVGGLFLVLFIVGSIQTSSYSSSLDIQWHRLIALACRTPRSTDYLRNRLDETKSEQGVSGGSSIDDILKDLERQGYIEWLMVESRWEITQKALDYIEKYHG